MNALVLGSGGREHALAWRLKRSPSIKEVFLYPGNAGTEFADFKTLSCPKLTIADVVESAKTADITLVVVGPEALLAEGYADELRSAGFVVASPSRKAAQLETSKVFAKEFMQRAGIPTADAFPVSSAGALVSLLSERRSFPVVLKLDGLAAGKGVVVAQTAEEGYAFTERIWPTSGEKEFGEGPHTVLVEEFIGGKELSYIGLCDGETFLPLASSTDFKRIHDGNAGPNTGGMGAISPSPYLNPELQGKIDAQVIQPLLKQLKADGLDYRGALYCGIMIDSKNDPYVLEFNTRFGDPETQAVLLRLESDFGEMMKATAEAKLSALQGMRWSNETAIYVVATSQGYPARPRLGDAITGLEAVDPRVQVFFSGVRKEGDGLSTGGGRVLGLGTLAPDADTARARLYSNLKRVNWTGIHYRTDIGVCS